MTRFVKVTGHALLLIEGQRGRWAFLCECGSVQTYLATQHDAIAAHRDHKVAVREVCPRCTGSVFTRLRRCAACGWFVGWGP